MSVFRGGCCYVVCGYLVWILKNRWVVVIGKRMDSVKAKTTTTNENVQPHRSELDARSLTGAAATYSRLCFNTHLLWLSPPSPSFRNNPHNHNHKDQKLSIPETQTLYGPHTPRTTHTTIPFPLFLSPFHNPGCPCPPSTSARENITWRPSSESQGKSTNPPSLFLCESERRARCCYPPSPFPCVCGERLRTRARGDFFSFSVAKDIGG